ncbi:hypothetical protein CYMTET_11759 [Cymbomonas tetramitiformis]|uniref:Uncharacterized protein n=1 Tax=Cymbomonas tetramitiformis TaxID=36881 RepID=A0AAE0LCQ5_9CHLO|nr:hypothetical protein CYMTET_11759 [Cymbomonas tetramitiformis]
MPSGAPELCLDEVEKDLRSKTTRKRDCGHIRSNPGMGDSEQENSYETQQGESVADFSNLRYNPMTGPMLGVSTGRVYTPSSSVNIFDFPGVAHEPPALEASTEHVEAAPILKDHFPDMYIIPQFFGQGASQFPETSEDSVGDYATRMEEQEDIDLPRLVPVQNAQDMLMCQPPCTVRPASRWFPSLSWESESVVAVTVGLHLAAGERSLERFSHLCRE